MELFKKVTQIDFMGMRKITAIVSITVSCLCILSLFVKGLNFGLEFMGGMQMELRFERPIETSVVRQELEKLGYQDLRVQHYGSSRDILVRIADSTLHGDQQLNQVVKNEFNALGNTVEIRRAEYIGSEVGEELAEQGSVAVLVAILSTMIYIALRFEYRLAVSAAVGLCHDGIVVLGIFSVFGLEFDLATLAAVLAILGYSLNDTIVVFDRVRENFRKMREGSIAQIMNRSINQTLSRTLMTSFLTLLVVIALLLFASESLFGFSLALFLGILIGTYSSIYVAGAFALYMGLSRTDLMPKPKGQEVNDLP